MKVGFITGRMSSLESGRRYAHSGVARLVDALRSRAGSLTVATSEAPSRPPEHDTELVIAAKDHLALPWQPSAIAGLSQGGASRRVIGRVEQRCDVVIFQLPFSPPWALSGRRRPRAYHVCADVPEVVRASKFYRGMKRVMAVSFAELTHTWTRLIVREPGVRTVTNGQALFERLGVPRGRSIVSSSLQLGEVGSIARRRASDGPLRLAFCGYLRPEKGLDTLAAAYAQVLSDIPSAELVIIGRQDLGEGGAVAELHARLAGRGHVLVRGLLPFGPVLFQELADADVLVVPSRSEGTPRVLVEARAFGCPVVATRVGGIPTSVTDGVDGVLVPPDDAEAIARAVLQIARDTALRERLRENGLARARAATVESLAEALLDEARAAYEEARHAA